MAEWLKIQGLLNKIRSTGRDGISADDPEAVTKLQFKLKELEQNQEKMKAVNAYCRKNKTLEGCPQLSSEEIERMKASMVRSWRATPKPYESFALTDNSANIRRVKARIAELTQRAETEYQGWVFEGGDGMNSADILHVRQGQNYLVDDFTRMDRLRDDPAAMAILGRVAQEIGFDRVCGYERVDDKWKRLPDVPFLYDMLEKPINSKKYGFHLGYSWCGGPCRWGTKLKTTALDGLALDAETHYVGIAVDELERLGRLESPKCSPLADVGMTEADCLAYCYEQGFFWEENGIRLYDILDRVSCRCCKNKNRKELKAIYQYLPQYWEQLKKLQSQMAMPMKSYSRKGVPYGNVFDMERVFEQEIQAEMLGGTPKQKRGGMNKTDKKGKHHLHIELTPAQYQIAKK